MSGITTVGWLIRIIKQIKLNLSRIYLQIPKQVSDNHFKLIDSILITMPFSLNF